MLATLAHTTLKQATDILRELADSLLPKPSEGYAVAHENVLQDIAETRGIEMENRADLLDAVRTELQSILLPAERVEETRRRLAAKGLLPRSLYEIRVQEGRLLLPDEEGHRCATDPSQVKVFAPAHGTDNFVVVATRQVDECLTSLVWGRSEGAVFFVVGGAWIFHDRLGYNNTSRVPVEIILGEFLANFGFDVAVAGKGISRIFWNLTIPALPEATDESGFGAFLKVVARPGQPWEMIAMARYSILHLYVIDLLFCIDTIKYRAELVDRGMWIADSLRHIKDTSAAP